MAGDKNPNIDIIDERTNVNTEGIKKIKSCLFGPNGRGGGVMTAISENKSAIKDNKTNIGWVKWLIVINTAALLGNIIRMSFSIAF